MALSGEPFIPEFITVHLGEPGADAPNVTVTFPDYVKNVASSEIFPTWPDSSLRANIYVIVTYALNRIYSEWYRSQGYPFDITNTTQYDQAFVFGRDIFQNVAQIADELFNDYVRKRGSVEPYFTAFCNGTTSTCDGLSQWGTVDLANRGLIPYDILRHYYGDDIDIVKNAPVNTNTPSYPGVPLREGDSGNHVQTIQVQLNRISRNYPRIPKITPVNGVYSASMRDTVRVFQEVFDLPVTGIVDDATWYRAAYLFNAVKRISELDSEGISMSDISRQYPSELRLGSTGNGVLSLEYFLAVIGQFYESVPPITVTKTFSAQTEAAVRAFQRTYGLPVTGIVDNATWQDIYRAYRGIIESTPFFGGAALFPGSVLSLGSQGEDVRRIQEYLSYISTVYPQIQRVTVSGLYGPQTQSAVIQFQELFGLPGDGVVGPVTWGAIAEAYSVLSAGAQKQPGQYPGYELGES